jgi:Uma2 family endonuclease
MCGVVLQEQDVRIPEWVVDLDSFSRWVDSDEFPEEGRICYLRGEVWVDMSWQQVFSHVKVKTVFTIVVGGLVQAEGLGEYFGDGLRIRHPQADLSVVPDGSFFSTKSLRSGRARLIEGATEGYIEVEGSADMVLEIISDSSVRKDTVRLRELYWDAGIREYWLVDARHDPLTFEILRHTAKGYVATRKQAGWLKSAVFGKSFRLVQEVNPLGHPVYTLDVR